MTTLADRIKMAMAESGVSQAELARACGVKPPSIHGWLSGKSKFLRGENLLLAARRLGVSQDWLATGKGEMRSASPKMDEGSLGASLKMTCETADELRLLTIFRLADEDGRAAINIAADLVAARFRLTSSSDK